MRTVEDIMTRELITVDMDRSLAQMDQIFINNGFHHLLVTDDDGRLVGVISDRDILRELSPYIGTLAETSRDKQTMAKKAHQIMKRDLVTVVPSTDLSTAMKLLLERRKSCLPVVDADGQLAGLVTWRDLMREAARNTQETDA